MIALFMGIFAGFFSFFLIDKTVFMVKQCILGGDFSKGLRAAAGVVAVQFLWAALLAIWLGLLSYYLKSGHHMNSIRGYDNSFVMLSALILGFSAYRLLRKPSASVYKKQYEDTSVPSKEFSTLLHAALAEPGRILIYLALFSLFGIHHVTSAPSTLFFLMLGTGFGAFLWWSLLCGFIAQHPAASTTEHLLKYGRAGAGFILILGVFGLVYSLG